MLHEVDRWVKTGKVDEVQAGSDQLRYTPKAIRRMAFAISSAFGDIADPSKPFNFPWKWEASLYLLMTGFMEHSELRDFFLTPGFVIKTERLPSKHIVPKRSLSLIMENGTVFHTPDTLRGGWAL